MSDAVLLLAHGTPDSLDEMEAYLTLVRGGRAPSAELVAEIRHNYAAIGGRSPLTDITRAQAAALSAALGGRPAVLIGMRNWRPFIAEAVEEAVRAGARDLLAIPLAPQYSTLSIGKYREAAERALPEGVTLRFVEAWNDHPELIEAFAERVCEAFRRGPRDAVLFTAHSLPERVAREGDPYPLHVRQTAEAVAERTGLGEARIVYQSAGRTPEPWLRPSLEDALRDLAERGCASVLVVPISFVCDHTEILYDIDIAAKETARSLGIDLTRTESLNTSPRLIDALAQLVRAHG
jgi:ferrochelatase